MDELLFIVTQKLAVAFVLSVSAMGGFLSMATPPRNPAPSQTAIMSEATILPIAITSSTATSTNPSLDLSEVVSGLLPTVTAPFCAASSTCGIKALKLLAAVSLHKNQAHQTAPATPQPQVAATIIIPSAPPIVPITAEGLLNSATLTFKEQRTGPYEIMVNTSADGENLTWTFDETNVGGTGIIPSYTTSFSCNPQPTPPAPGAPDQNPSFQPDTAYDCTVSLTPLTGTDLRTQSRDFQFTTPPGQLSIAPAAAVSNILTNNTNDSGIIFNNEDTDPVTVTGLTLDASYADLNAFGQPLVLRILDPATNQSVFDYHLESTSTNPTAGFTNDKSDITAPLSFTIPGSSQKLLPIQVLGVQKMLIPGSSPTITITVQGVTTNRGDIKTNVSTAAITWSCIVSTTGYDPNATNTPFALGDACTN